MAYFGSASLGRRTITGISSREKWLTDTRKHLERDEDFVLLLVDSVPGVAALDPRLQIWRDEGEGLEEGRGTAPEGVVGRRSTEGEVDRSNPRALLCNLTFSLLETAVFVINAKKDSLLSLAYL